MKEGLIKKSKKRIDHVLPNFANNTLILYYKEKQIKDVTNQCIFNLNNGDNKDNYAVFKNIHEVYKWIDPHVHNINSKHHLVDSDNSLVGCMAIDPLVGTNYKIMEIVADISSNEVYVHFRNMGNNINNSNDVASGKIKFFSHHSWWSIA